MGETPPYSEKDSGKNNGKIKISRDSVKKMGTKEIM
jgi:hypothetical protein